MNEKHTWIKYKEIIWIINCPVEKETFSPDNPIYQYWKKCPLCGKNIKEETTSKTLRRSYI